MSNSNQGPQTAKQDSALTGDPSAPPSPDLLSLIEQLWRSFVAAVTRGLSSAEREELACLYYPPALAWAERAGVKDPSDLVAPVFNEALDKYQPGRASFPTFLFGLLRWRLIDWFRAQSRRPVFETLTEDFDPPGSNPVPYADRAALDAALAQAWRQLNSIEQRLVWLHYVVGFTYPEIGAQREFIGCSMRQATLRSRVSRAVAKLRPFLLPFDDVSEDELIEAVHRTANAAGTLTWPPAPSHATRRELRRRSATRARCARRCSGKYPKNPPPQSPS
jgi:RNA polymerase sigma factor (sigma-70 family)